MTTQSHNDLMAELRQVTDALLTVGLSKEEKTKLKDRLLEINNTLFAAYPEY